MNSPLWATPGRRAKLAQLFLKEQAEFAKEFYNSLDLVVFGDLSISELADLLTRRHFCELIEAWKAQDRDERSTAWKYEKRHLHQGPNPGRRPFKRGPFDSIAREEYLANRPLWKIDAVGVGALTFRRVARVEIPALEKVIWVDLSGVDEGLSKNARRKLVRYRQGKLSKELEESVFARCRRAVAQYLAS